MLARSFAKSFAGRRVCAPAVVNLPRRCMATVEPPSAEESEVAQSNIMQRFTTTAEVTISKIFPAGFGWQYFSVLAGDMGYQTTDLGFAMMTGIGEGSFVLMGHTAYYALKKIVDPSVDLAQELQTGMLLGSAAVCSGFAWQPAVNMLQSADLPFMSVALGAWAICGSTFFGGLRLFRTLYSPVMEIAPASTGNIAQDALLSVSIGGATGAFVGTDVAYMNGEGNFLRPLVGVEDGDSAITGCIKAGSSTGMGFVAAQAMQNVVVPSSYKNWTD